MSHHHIQYLQRAAIDTVKWDQCIDTASNGLVYGYSVYLDNMARQWDALVLNDYEAVMPLPWKKKYGLYYLAHAPLTASQGVFGKAVTETLTEAFIRAIPARFKVVDLLMNPANVLPHSRLQLMRSNYVLDLNRAYEVISSHYKNNIRRNIKKAQQLGCRYATDVPVEEVIKLAHWQMQQHVTNITDDDYEHFTRLYHQLEASRQAICCGVYTDANELVASCVYFFSHGRAYYVLVGNHPNGKTIGASHYLIDRFIAANAGKPLLLDFEGSDIPSLAFFYGSFGSHKEEYPVLQYSRLPWWLRWAKKGFPQWQPS
jgi:hypothetical protein